MLTFLKNRTTFPRPHLKWISHLSRAPESAFHSSQKISSYRAIWSSHNWDPQNSVKGYLSSCYFQYQTIGIRWLRWQRIYLWCKRPGFNPWVTKLRWRRAWLPTAVFLPGNSPWTEEPGGLQSIVLQRVGHDWATNTFTLSKCSKIGAV